MNTRTLEVAPPFEFGHSLAAIRAFGPTRGEQRVDDETLHKAIRVLGRTVQVTARAGSAAHTLDCTLAADLPLAPDALAAALDRVRFYLGLDDDVGAFYNLAADDRPFRPVLNALHGYHQVKFPTPFENVAWTVLTQGLPTPAAHSLKGRLTRGYGGQVGDLWAFPEAADLAAVPEDDLADTLGNARKATYLARTARAFTRVDGSWLLGAPHAEVRAWLLSLPGIGPWSAYFVMLRGLGRGEGIFEGPGESFLREIRQAAAPHYGPLSDDDLRGVAERYGSWAGYWANYLRAAAAQGVSV